MISGAYLAARGGSGTPLAQASTETALLEQIAQRDSTGDGLPDWEKSLYGIPLDATSTDYFGLGMTDGEAVAKGLLVPKADGPAAATPAPDTANPTMIGGTPAPERGSLTDTFAKSFFSLYVAAMQANGGSLTNDQINTLAQQALQQLSASATPAPDFKTMADIKVSGSGPDALKGYAAAVEHIMSVHGAKLPESELQYLQDYLDSNDSAALDHIRQLAAAYHDTASGLSALTVPQELATTHLALINALARIGDEATDFSRVTTDPLVSMLALQNYPQEVANMIAAFSALQGTFESEHVSIPSGQPGAQFQILVSNLAKPRAPSEPTP